MPLSLPKDKKKKKIDEVEERLSPKKVSDLSFSEARAIREQYGSLKNYELATDKNTAKRIDEQMQDLSARRLVDAATSRGTPVEAESYGKNNKWNDYTTVMSERKTDYDRAVEKLKKDLDAYSPVADVSGVKNYLDATKAGYDYPVAFGKAMAERGAQFKSADDFKRWSIGWDEIRAGDENFEDTEETRKARQEYYEGLKKRRAELQAEKNTALVDYPDSNTSNVYGSEEWQNRENILADANKNNDEIEALDAEIARYERFMEVQDKYAKLREDPNFERYAEIEATHSGYGIDKNGNTTGDNVVDNYFGVSEKYKDVNVTDPMFDAMYGVSDQERNLIDFGYDYSLDELTEEEKQTYRYLLSTQGADSADQFLEDMKPTLNRRAVQREANELKNASGWELAIRNIVSVPQNIFGGVTAAIADVVQGDNKNPYDKWHRDAISASAVRGETAERMGNVGGFIYQSLMSAADSVAGAALMGRAYTLTMGAGASANRTRELYEKGASNYQILTSALASGLTEVVTEYVSIDKFLNDFLEAKPKNARDLIKKIFTQGGVEASEEFAAEVLNAIQDEEIMGSQSEMNLEIKEQMDKGVSREEAQRQVLLNHFVEAVKAAAGGFISGVAMGGGAGVLNSVGNAIDTRREGRYVNENNGAEALQNLAREVAGAPNLTKAVDKVTKKASNKNVGKLSRALEQTVSNEADADIRAEKGAKYTLAREGVDLSDVKAREGTNLYNNVDVSEKISDTGTTVDTETGGEVTIDETNPITQRDGKTYLNTSAGEILQDDIKYSSEKEAQLYEYVSDLPQSVANAIVENYNGQENVRGYVNGMRDGILLYGYNNIENAPSNTAFATLDKADQNYARQIGQRLAAEDLNNVKQQTVGNHVAVQETATTSGERVMNLNEIGLKATPAVAKKIGAGGTAGAVYTKGDVDLNSAMGRADGLLAYVYSSIAGNSVVLYDSKTVKDADLKNANGKHVASDGTIYLDVRAEAGNNVTGGIAYTLGHELTHEAEQWAKKEYAAFRKFLYENYIEKGTAVEDLIAKKMSDLDTTDRAYAESEVVADACERMLLDSDAMEKLAELQDKEPGTFRKIVDFIKRALEKIVGKFNSIREVYETMGAENTRIESKLVQEFGDNLKKLQDMWSDMVVKAAQNRAAAVENEQTAEATATHYQKKSAVEKYADFDKPITQADVEALRGIGRKSINAFTSEEIEKAQKWAYKFYREIGTKSPFFRAWFGDWRAYDGETKIEYVPVNTSRTTPKDIPRNGAKNGDTGWRISVNRDGIDETSHVRGKWSKEYRSLQSVNDMLARAILIDTVVVDKPSDRLGNAAAFIHHFYCPLLINEEKAVAKLYVTEEVGNKNVLYLTKIETVPTDSTGLGNSVVPDSSVDTAKMSVAQIYDFVKRNNSRFEADSDNPTKFEPKPVHPAMLNKDGTPKVFYHGTNADFSVFDLSKAKPGFYGKGFYFTDSKSQADVYGNTIEAYLRIENPLTPGGSKVSADQIRAFLEAVAENEDYSIENYGTYDINSIMKGIESRDAFAVIQDVSATAIGDMGEAMRLFNEINGTSYDGIVTPTESVVFEPTQIKSATNNIGTFDPENPDINYSRKSTESYAVRDIVDRALKRLDPSSAEYRAMAKYKAELDTLDNMRAQLDEAIKSGDRQAQTRLTNNIKTQRGILNRIENSASMKNVASMRDVTRLADDAKKLREMLKLQSRETNGTIAKQKSVNAAASEIMEKYGIKRGKGELAELLGNYYTKMMQSVNNETMTREAALDQAKDVAEWIARHVPDEIQYDDGAIEALDMLRGYKVKLNDDQRQNIRAKYDGINGWRRAVGGYITLSNEGKYLDELWPEWAERAPGYFTNEMLSDADMPERLAEIIDSLKKSRETVIEVPGQYEYDLDRAANDVYEAFWNIEPEQTVADKYAERIKTLKAEHNAMMSDLRKSFRDTIREERSTMYSEAKERARQYEEKLDLRRKIRKVKADLTNRLDKPTVKKYVPKDLRSATAELLSALNLVSEKNEPSQKTLERIAKLQAIYDSYKDENVVYDQQVAEWLTDLRDTVGSKTISELSTDELKSVYKILKAFTKNITEVAQVKSLYASGVSTEKTVDVVAKEWMRNIERINPALSAYFNTMGKLLGRPELVFRIFGNMDRNSISTKVYDMMNAAQLEYNRIRQEGNRLFEEMFEGKENEKYLKELHDTKELYDIGLKDANGKPVEVTKDFALWLYRILMNENGIKHVSTTGGVMPDLKKYYNGGEAYGKKATRVVGFLADKANDILDEVKEKSADIDEQIEQAKSEGDYKRIKELWKERDNIWSAWNQVKNDGREALLDTVQKNISDILTPQDKRFLELAAKFYDEWSKGYMNKASNERHGIDIADEENYTRIHTAEDYRGASFDNNNMESAIGTENMGFTKRRVGATNPIYFEGLSSAIAKHIDEVATYAAYLNPLYDLRKILNYTEGGINKSGTVRSKLNEKFGKGATNYIYRLAANVKGQSTGGVGDIETVEKISDKLLGRTAEAALTANGRVIAYQAVSALNAASELGYGTVAKTFLTKFVKKAPRDLIAKYTPILEVRRSNGSSDEVANMKRIAKNRGVWYKLTYPATHAIQAMDLWTVGRLWFASESYVKGHNKNLKPGSEEFYQAVGKKFTDVVELTQPNYTPMQRNQLQRSKNPLARALAMFKTQPFQNLNNAIGASFQFAHDVAGIKNGTTTKAEAREAGAKLYRSISSLVISSAMVAVINAAWKAFVLHGDWRWRDEETGEFDWDDFGRWFIDEALTRLFGTDPLTSEAYNFIGSKIFDRKYYPGFSMPQVELVTDALQSLSDSVDATKDKKWNPKKEGRDLASKIGRLFGIPVDSIVKPIEGIYQNTQDIINGEFGSFNYGYEYKNKQLAAQMLYALEADDEESYKKARGKFPGTKTQTPEEQADTALKKAIGDMYMNDKYTREEAKDKLKAYLGTEDKDAEEQLDKWDYADEHGSQEGYKKYDDFYEAVRTGKNLKVEIKDLQDRLGVEPSTLASQITQHFKPMYKDMTNGQRASLKGYLLNAYVVLGYDRDKKSKDIDKWLED